MPLSYNLLGLQLGGRSNIGYAELSPETQELVSPTKGRYNFRVPVVEELRGFYGDYAYTLYTNIDPTKRIELSEEE